MLTRLVQFETYWASANPSGESLVQTAWGSTGDDGMLETYGHMRLRLGDWMQQDAGDRSGAGAEVTGQARGGRRAGSVRRLVCWKLASAAARFAQRLLKLLRLWGSCWPNPEAGRGWFPGPGWEMRGGGGGCLPAHIWSCPVVVAEVRVGATVQINVRSLSLADKIRRLEDWRGGGKWSCNQIHKELRGRT